MRAMLDKACRLLRGDESSIEDIDEQCGHLNLH